MSSITMLPVIAMSWSGCAKDNAGRTPREEESSNSSVSSELSVEKAHEYSDPKVVQILRRIASCYTRATVVLQSSHQAFNGLGDFFKSALDMDIRYKSECNFLTEHIEGDDIVIYKTSKLKFRKSMHINRGAEAHSLVYTLYLDNRPESIRASLHT